MDSVNTRWNILESTASLWSMITSWSAERHLATWRYKKLFSEDFVKRFSTALKKSSIWRMSSIFLNVQPILEGVRPTAPNAGLTFRNKSDIQRPQTANIQYTNGSRRIWPCKAMCFTFADTDCPTNTVEGFIYMHQVDSSNLMRRISFDYFSKSCRRSCCLCYHGPAQRASKSHEAAEGSRPDICSRGTVTLGRRKQNS